jgi:hypothetical protein
VVERKVMDIRIETDYGKTYEHKDIVSLEINDKYERLLVWERHKELNKRFDYDTEHVESISILKGG